MKELPKGFPEYSIMYKTLSKKIVELEKKIEIATGEEKNKMQESLERYQLEKEKIGKMFPDKFFE